MTTKREFAYLVGGIGIGVYGPRLIPKIPVVKLGKFYKEIFAARKRLRKIVIEEYYRIDDAIRDEESFLKMIDPHVMGAAISISFEVMDNENGRDIHVNINHTKS